MNIPMNCGNCSLSASQYPLLDAVINADVMWVGLSTKLIDGINHQSPLGDDTNTGKIIFNIESVLPYISFYKTNSVKCPPLDNYKKLRYPTASEMDICYSNLLYEMEMVKPKLILLLGERVATFILRKLKIHDREAYVSYNYKSHMINDVIYVPVHHPSYIRIYKFKELAKYEQGIINIISRQLNTEPERSITQHRVMLANISTGRSNLQLVERIQS